MLVIRHKAIDRNNAIRVSDNSMKMIGKYIYYFSMNEYLFAFLEA